MSNLLKSNRVVVKNDNKLVIDTNQMVMDLIAERNARASEVNYGQKAEEPDEDGFVCGLDATTVEQLISDEPDLEQIEENREIISKAEEEANEIIENAKLEAQKIYEEAKEEGYKAGLDDAKAYIDELIVTKKEEADRKCQKRLDEIEADYEKRCAEIEPRLANVLADVFSKVTLAIAEDNKDVLVSLIEKAIKNTEGNGKFIIKVSEDDFSFVSNSKDSFRQLVSLESVIEVVRDEGLTKNQCIIETDVGVVNCSLDIQLENLKSEIRLLNCLNNINK